MRLEVLLFPVCRFGDRDPELVEPELSLAESLESSVELAEDVSDLLAFDFFLLFRNSRATVRTVCIRCLSCCRVCLGLRKVVGPLCIGA